MRFIWAAMRKDLLRHRRDPMALLLWLLIPLGVSAGIYLATGGRSGPKPSALVLVVDQDGSFASRLLAGAFNQAGDIMRSEVTTLEQGQLRINKGDASALVVIPGGFGQAVLEEKPTRLTLITNPEQTILPKIVEDSLGVLADGVFYIHRVFGRELHALAQGPPGGATTFPDQDVAGLSVSFNQAAARLSKYLFPPVIKLETSVESRERGSTASLAVLFLPGIVLMALLFMAQGMSDDLWRERLMGTLRRAAGTPRGVAELLAGKLLAGTLLIFGISLLLLVLGMSVLSLPLSNLPLALTWSVLAGIVFMILMVLIQVHATSQRAGSVLSNTIVFPLLMAGGSFFPSDVMPRWMAAVGRWTPNGWAVERLKDILLDREDPGVMILTFAVFIAVALLALFLSARRVRRVFAVS